MPLSPSQTQHLLKLSQSLQTEFSDLEILAEALTHRSYLNEVRQDRNNHNERLEFLGDAVLELITTRFLFEKYPHRPEGDLTSFRAALVRTESLAEEATKLGLGEYIFMSRGEEATGGRERPYILANTFEAVIGAMFLDQNYEACDAFVKRELLYKIDRIVDKRLDIDPKSKLQEIAQEVIKFTPTYRLKNAAGPDHDKTFAMEVVIDDFVFGQGNGRSKQEAEQQAAQYALDNWENLYKNYQKSGKISPSDQQ